MEVKFDMVRIGKFRENPIKEALLRQNVQLFMKDIEHFLCDKAGIDGVKNRESVTLIIPGKGLKPKFRLQDFKDIDIRMLMKKKFRSYIYNGKLDAIMDNVGNRVFR